MALGATLSTIVYGWLNKGLFWLILIAILALITFGFLIYRKRKKLKFPCLIYTELGGGKVGIQRTKAGWFKTKSAFFGLWDYGSEEVMKTKDNRVIQQASSEDFNEIDGIRGIMCIRSGADPKVLLPLNKADLKDKKLLLEIAPADYRDTANKIVEGAKKEMAGFWDKYGSMIIMAGLIVFALISILIITQMITKSQTQISADLRESRDLIKEIANQIGSIRSNAP